MATLTDLAVRIAQDINATKGSAENTHPSIISAPTVGHGWTAGPTTNATFTLNDTTTSALGDRSIAMTTDGTGAAASYVQLTGFDLDMTGKGFLLWVHVTNIESVATMTIQASSGDAATMAPRVVINLPVSTGGKSIPQEAEWFPLYVSFGNATPSIAGTFDRSSVKALRVTLQDTAGQPSPTVRVGGLGTFKDTTPAYPNGVVSFMFDDSYASHVYAAKFLAAHGFAGTEYPINSRVGTAGHVTVADLHHLRDAYGWEIGAHASDNAAHVDWRTQTPEWIRTELEAQKAWQAANNLPAESFAYPIGPFNAEASGQAANHYTSARSTYPWTNSAARPSAHRLASRVMASSTTLAAAQTQIDRTVAGGGWLCLMFHDLVDAAPSGNDMLKATFQAIVAAVAASGLPVATVRQVING